MKKEKAEKGFALLKEIKELSDIKQYTTCAHFTFIKRWKRDVPDTVAIAQKHTGRLIAEIEKIIKELEAKLKEL